MSRHLPLNRTRRFGSRERCYTDQLICAPVTDRIEGTVPEQIGGYLRVISVPSRNGVWTSAAEFGKVLGARVLVSFPVSFSASRGPGGSGGVGFEPDGAEVVAGGEAHVGVERGGQAP